MSSRAYVHSVPAASSPSGMRRLLVLVLVLCAACAASSADAQTPATPTIEYYHLDALGSVRAVTDYAGVEIRRHELMPFGEEWTEDGTPGPAETRLFTGKERDSETSLDYFGARYYRAEIGRFTTVDPGHVGGDIFDPQTWNAYAYAGNNPLRNIDPDGRRWFSKNGEAKWVEPNKDGSYTSPGEGWVELDPSQYPPSGMHVAYVNGQLSRIGEDAEGHKMLAPWMPPEQGLEDTSFSLFQSLGMGGSFVSGGLRAIVAAGGRGAVSESTALMTQAAMTVGNKGAMAATKQAALETAEKWVGPGARVIRSRTGQIVGKISADGQRVYRITSLNKAQPYINLESKAGGGNLHIRW